METTKRTRLGTLLLLGTLVVGMLATALPAAAVTAGTTEGCTPGYWKTHPQAWQEYSPTQTVKSVFSAAASTPYGNLTLMQALSLRGGSTLNGAKEILLRAAVAALLNAAYDTADGSGLLFPWRRDVASFGRPALIPTVNAALLSTNRTAILALAAWLDRDNNLGCPLS